MTKICIFGAGSIGGFIATSLKKTNAQVSLIARGEHKKAIEQNGLTFIRDDNKVNLDFMPKINTLSFGVRVEGDDDFPPLLFDFISSLKDNKTIVSLAECVEGESIHSNKCELIYEANLKRFMKEIVNSE